MSNARAEFSRRGVLFAGAATLVTSGLGACSARAVAIPANAQDTGTGGQAAPAIPASQVGKVRPSSAWRGAAGSGFSNIPVDPVRVTAKPALRWNVAQFQRFAGDLVVIAEADALGGIAYVDFFVEGATARVANWTRISDTDANGAPRMRTGYAITLDHAAFMAQSASGNAINIYARATANDTTMQQRVIGPLTLYPEATESDFVKTIRLDGTGDYPSIRSALRAAQAVGAKAPVFTFTQTGFYEFENGDWGAWYTGRGYAVFQGAPGVLATIGRANFPDPNKPASWPVVPLWNGLEFRGMNVLIDFRNFAGIQNSNGPTTAFQNHRLNGTKVTNSIGTEQSFYWNKGYRPQGLFSTQPSQKAYGSIPGYSGGACIEDTILEYGNAHVMNTELCRGAKLYHSYERLWNGGMAVFDCYADRTSVQWFRNERPALTITYVGAGTATVALAGNNGTANRTLTLTANGAATNITLGTQPSDVNYTIKQVVASINAIGNGWSAVQIDTGDTDGAGVLSACYLGRPHDTNGFTAQTLANGTQYSLVTHVEAHEGGGNFYSPGMVLENLIWRNNVALNIDYLGQLGFSCLLMDNTKVCNDFIFDAQIWDGGNFVSWGSSGCPLSHAVLRNCVMNQLHVTISGAQQSMDNYTAIVQCVIVPNNNNNTGNNAISIGGGAMDASNLRVIDCFAPGANSAVSQTGCFGTYGDPVFVNPGQKDFRPTGVLVKTANKRAPLRTIDLGGTARSNPDAIGAFAASAPEKFWPTSL